MNLSTRGRRARLASALAASLVATISCTAAPRPVASPSLPTYIARKCPVDVEAALVGTVQCGTLRVREDRHAGTGTVDLLVTRLTPPAAATDDPVVVVGTDLATRPNYAGIGVLAQRTGRPVVFFEQRGTVHSSPSLVCSEPPRAIQRAWTTRTGSLAWLRVASRATASCYAQLTGRGLDVAAYGVAEMALDLRDLIETLHLGPAELISFGSSSRIVLAVLRAYPELVRAAVMDSPDVPGYDPRTRLAATTEHAVHRVLDWCQTSRNCQRRYADPKRLLDRALASLAARPLRLAVDVRGARERVVLDDALLARVVRQSLTDGGSAGTWGEPTSLPRLLEAAADRDVGRLRSALRELLGAQGPWCAGYRGKCMTAHTITEGVWNTTLCEDVATRAGRRQEDARPGFRSAYDGAWWWGVCPHWPVRRAPSDTGPLRTDVPLLVLVGGLAPATPIGRVRSALAGSSQVSFVVDPTQSHNVLGHECLDALRDGWLEDPRPVRSEPSCVPDRLAW